MSNAYVAHVALKPEHAEIVAATLPLIGANIDEITVEFYRRMFVNRPELLRNLFNRGNQAQGIQQRALAASIATFAAHLVNPDLPYPAELLSRIANKHASLGITPDKYSIVHENLFAAIVDVIGAETVTAEVAEAWDRVYWTMADELIGRERGLYDEAGVAGGDDVYHRVRVLDRIDDPSGAVVLTVASPSRAISAAGQYLSVGVTLPDGSRQLRQYSVISQPGSANLTFAVKPVPAGSGNPAGEVSNWIRANVRVGDFLDSTIPFGDLPKPASGDPVVLISAGIGITPMIGLLESLAVESPSATVRALHADVDESSHPLRQRQRELIAALPNATLDLWYENPADTDAHPGFLNLDDVNLPDGADIYLCGANAFVQAVRAQLLNREIAPTKIHCELFSPNDWLLG